MPYKINTCLFFFWGLRVYYKLLFFFGAGMSVVLLSLRVSMVVCCSAACFLQPR